MFRMSERLKLSNLFGVQLGKSFFCHGFLHDTGQKLRLSAKLFGSQADGFTRPLDGGEVDVCGQVLFTRIGQQVISNTMPIIGPQRPACAGRRKHLFGRKSIINRKQFAM